MGLVNIKIEGKAHLETNEFIFVCAFCGNHDKEKSTIEFNFREQKIFYLCTKCKKMNELNLNPKSNQTPFPKSRLGR